MKFIRTGGLAIAMAMIASAAFAAPLKLQPASPQPSNPKAGLDVKYKWEGNPPRKIQNMAKAKQLIKKAQPGTPLIGLDYRDTTEGEPVLTFNQAYNVAAQVTGYIRFDAPGIYELETWSNDGIDAWVGGQQIGYVSGIQGCDANQRTEVEVPQAGWYALKIDYFQKKGTSCLMMKWGKQGERFTWTPNDVFGR
ncbi:PA14 domain-containing protein [Ruegeria sp.]|uniref:PA14 domain-containing protein n=1 Tax=Ruegeria sp. TaxID=1879320 RepID=UPI00230FC1E5|nr:PA14 domain-containing protein [Ruegeria sp.]MDA7966160.1 PA14 domain-containing protein [Ruegeria sp.]